MDKNKIIKQYAKKQHAVLNRHTNFPTAYWCVGEKPHYFTQQGGYEYNFEVATWTDNFGATEAMKTEADMHAKDDYSDSHGGEGTVDIAAPSFVVDRPDNTDTFLFLSKNAPFDMMSSLVFSGTSNVVPDQDSTISAVIRAHNFKEASNMFNQIKDVKLDYSEKPGNWMTYRKDGLDK